MGFLKPFVPYPSILDEKPKDPLGYVTNDGMWAAVPLGNTRKFVIIHNGSQVKVLNLTNNLLISSTTNGKPLKRSHANDR